MRSLLCIAIVGLLLAATAIAATVRFEGPEPVNAEEVRRLAARPTTFADSLFSRLEAEGYLEATVLRDHDTVVIAAGQRIILAELVVTENNDTSRASINEPCAHRLLSQLVDSVLDRRRERGHYYASASISEIARSSNNVILYLRLVPGPVMRIAGIHYLGLQRITPALLERFIPVAEGDSLTDQKLSGIEEAASAISFVRFIPPVVVRPRPGYTDADLELTFVEDRPLALDLGGGYIPDNQKNQYVWHVNARFNNLLGGGRQARILSERREADRQILQISYVQPVFLLGPGAGHVEVATRDYRESFYEFSLAVGLETPLQPSLTAGVDLGYRSVEPSGEAPSYDAYQVSFRAVWDRLDNPLNPSRGFRAATVIGYTHRRYAQGSSASLAAPTFNETRTRFDLAAYQPVLGPLMAYASIGYRGLETGEDLPPLSELILIGGPGTIRGYRNEQFAVIRAATFTLEPRIRFSSSYLFGFYDGAYLNNRIAVNGLIKTDESYRSGFGLGLAVVADHRAVTLSLGWNPDLGYDAPRLSIQFSSDI